MHLFLGTDRILQDILLPDKSSKKNKHNNDFIFLSAIKVISVNSIPYSSVLRCADKHCLNFLHAECYLFFGCLNGFEKMYTLQPSQCNWPWMLSTEFEDLFLSYFVMQWHRADLYCKYVCMDITSFLKHVYYHNVMYSRISNKWIDVCFPETCNNKSGSWADLQI